MVEKENLRNFTTNENDCYEHRRFIESDCFYKRN